MTLQTTIALDRRFRSVTSEEAASPALLFATGAGGEIAWSDLLAQRRVVVLAEAGSGKSHEFRAQAALARARGDHACYVTVQDVARSGLDAALGPVDSRTFAVWQADETARCWLFIDSIDEAKDEGLSFDTAVRQLARAVSGREERVSILISGRFTDWDFAGDPQAMAEWLSIPPPLEPLPDFRDLIVDTLHNKKPPKPAAEPAPEITLVLMTPLDPARVRLFADGARVEDADAFMAAIEAGDLWGFAGRPLDLDWMTAYWRDNRRLGRLAEMLEASLDARSVEIRASKRRRDPLSIQKTQSALRRIGAGLVLTGAETVCVPSADGAQLPVQRAMDLDQILADRPAAEVGPLLSRPVFDPATLGRVRLHNDNEGVVRSYLAARWLDDRLSDNCPPQAVHDLLFADLYGRSVVCPDMAQTAAWLALRRPAIAEAYLARDPISLLTTGDPASLPPGVRAALIERALEAVTQPGHSLPWYSQGFLRRIVDPSFEASVDSWWSRYGGIRDCRHLILQMIEMAGLATGLDIVREVARDVTLDPRSQVLAGRALVALGTVGDVSDYAADVRRDAATLPRAVVLSALSALFPSHYSVAEFFELIDVVGVEDGQGNPGVYPLGGELHDDIATPADLIAFIHGVLARSGDLGEDQEDPPFVDAFGATVVSAGLRLLKIQPDDPADVVVDLVLRLNEGQWSRLREVEERELAAALVSSPRRRRWSFWRAVEVLKDHPWQGRGLPTVNQLAHHGWPGNFSHHDLDWLLEDATGQESEDKRSLAFETGLFVCRQLGDLATDLARFEAAAALRPDLNAALAAWRAPPSESPALKASLAKMEAQRRTHDRKVEKRDASWVLFIEELRADPKSLERLLPQTDTTADRRLVDLYTLLSSRLRSRNRYAIESLASVEPILGPEVTRRFGAALIAFARQRTPPAPGPQGGGRSNFDIMGLVGVSLEAATTERWTQSLDDAAARRAALYALVELNGFPDYLDGLAASHPQAVRAVLEPEVRAQVLDRPAEAHGLLDRLAYADRALAQLVTPVLASLLTENSDLPEAQLSKMVDALVRGSPAREPGLGLLAAGRFRQADEPATAALYLALLFAIDADQAVRALDDRLNALSQAAGTKLCVASLPRLFGDHFGIATIQPRMSFDSLQNLVRIAFGAVRLSDDIDRTGRGVYSPGRRDNAQEARDAIFNVFKTTPGEATYAALMRFAQTPDFPIPSTWLTRAARERVETDAALEPWRAQDLIVFEQTFERPPTTSLELQMLVRRRIEQIAHDLVHGKFAQADTVRGLVDENAVQRWVADRFETLRGLVYTLERETHVVGEKEPDILITSQANGVTAPIEIKVIDEMSLAELEIALEHQLCGQYLRHAGMRHGVLLLIHQKGRSVGWRLTGEGFVPIDRIMARLEDQARLIRSRDPAGPQPIVLLVDVSSQDVSDQQTGRAVRRL